MAETSKNKIYYNDNENSVADVLADMKKMAESTDKAIENSKYNDAQIKKDISDAKKEQALKDAEQDNKIIELQNEKAKLEKELKEAQEDFYQNSIRGQASGEYIHVEDSSNCRAKIGIGGNHEQETRSGKNKIEITKTTTTVNGCTHTIKDGTDTLSGTSTGWANIIIYSFTGDGKTYTLSGSPSTSKNIFISAHDNVQKKDLATSKNGSTGTFVATSGNSIDIIICVAPNLTLANELFKPQLEEGLKATVWEQGGASPSPDYPSKIEVVGSNVNLFAGGDTVTNNGVTFTKNKDDSYDIVGMAKEQANCIKFVDIQNSGIINGNIYNIHVSENLPDGVKILIEAYNDAAWIRHVLGSSLIPNVSKANIENVNKIRFTLRVEKGISVNIHNLRIKLEKDTIETAYSKYGQGCIKVTKCNKNIFKETYNRKDVTSAYISLVKGKGFFEKDKTYVISFDTTNNGGIVYLGEDFFQHINAFTVKCDGTRKFFTVKAKKFGYVIDTVLKTRAVTTNAYNISNVMINEYENDTDIDYVQHEEQSYIIPTQAEMLVNDYLDYDNEEEVHTWGKKILTGDENWKLESTGRFGIIKSDLSEIPAATSNDNDYLGNMCNSYKESTPSLTWKKVQGFCVDMSSCLRIYDDKYSTNNDLEGFKTYLKSKYDAGTPVVIYYKLQTPTRLKFTDEQKAVAKELNNARTYKNVTNITTDSKAILSLDYAKDQETQNQKMQNEIDEIKQLLSTTQTSAMLLDNLQKEVESEVE
nr:MAG TPA: hypothetical protein [Bacteriophage sp.]